MFMLGAVSGLLGGAGGAAAGAAGAAAGTAGAAASTGISISTILQGVATIGGVVASIAAGNAESESLKAQARDAEAEKPIETLQHVERRRSLLKAAQESVGELDAAYASSGVDLSFGSARQARENTFREADIGLNSDAGTTASRLNRLSERASNYYRMAKNARKMGVIGGLTRGLGGLSSLMQQV